MSKNTKLQVSSKIDDNNSLPLIHKNSFIYVNGSIESIENIWNKYKSKTIINDKNGGEWTKPIMELIVNSYDEKTGLIKQVKLEYLYRQKNTAKSVREIKLWNGQTIVYSLHSKLLTVDKWSKKIKENDFIMTPRILYNNKRNINIVDNLMKINIIETPVISTGPVVKTISTNIKVVATRSPYMRNKYGELIVTNELAYLLAWQIAEGYETKFLVQITQHDHLNDTKILDSLVVAANKVSEQYGIWINPIKQKNNIELNIYGVQYINFLNDNGYNWGQKSKGKRIPDYITNASPDIIRLFLRNYFDAEAHMHEEKGVIELSSASQNIIQQIYHMLKIFQINSRIFEKMKCATNGTKIKRNYYFLYISSFDLRIYKEHIGFGFRYKRKALNNACKRPANTNIDILPIKHLLYNLRLKTNLPYRKVGEWNYIGGKQFTTSKVIKNVVIKNLDNLISDKKLQKEYNLDGKKIIDIMDLNCKLKKIVDGDIYFVKIKSTQRIQYDGYMYNFKITDSNNFIADGAIFESINCEL